MDGKESTSAYLVRVIIPQAEDWDQAGPVTQGQPYEAFSFLQHHNINTLLCVHGFFFSTNYHVKGPVCFEN